MQVAPRKKGAISKALLKDCAILDTKTGRTYYWYIAFRMKSQPDFGAWRPN
jgi:hypothetical protein